MGRLGGYVSPRERENIKKKAKKKPSPYFQTLIDHIDQSWVRKKGLHYPFSGRDFKDLKAFCVNFQEWGLMALWDAFIGSDNEWVRKSGYSISAFIKCLPWLVDDKSWKRASQKYEIDMALPLSPELFPIVDNLLKTAKGKTNV